MSDKITNEEIQQLAEESGVHWLRVKMLLIVESSGVGFNKDGSLKLRFEEEKFYDRTGVLIDNDHSGQAEEKRAYEQAKQIDRDAANLSTSWGLAQIMGNEYERAGYDSVDKMIGEFRIGEFYHVKAMLSFCKSKPKLWAAFSKRGLLAIDDCNVIAYYYNGPGHAKHNPPYGERLFTTYTKLRKTYVS